MRVRAKLAGVWGSYGNTCTVTTPASKTAGELDFGVAALEATVLPNPSNGRFTVALSEATDGELSVVSLTGEVIAQQRINGNRAELALEHCAPGIYLLTVVSENALFTERLVIQ